jgi:hypothetical protein
MAKDDSPNINKLKAFLRRYNMPSVRAAPRNLTAAVYQTFGNEVIAGMYRQYFDNDNGYSGIRPSNAYKPAITHVLNKFGYCHGDERVKWNRAYAPFIGHVTEELIVLLLTEANVNFTRGERMSILNGAMHGTADIIIDDLVIDVKSMNGYYYRKFSEQPDDERGYVTQLHLYGNALNTRNMAVLALCKDYPSMKLIPINYHEECLDSVKRRIDLINAAHTIEGIRNCAVPSLQSLKAGLTVPTQLKYCPSKQLLYSLTDPDDEFCNTAYAARTHNEILALLADVHTEVTNDVLLDDDLPY